MELFCLIHPLKLSSDFQGMLTENLVKIDI